MIDLRASTPDRRARIITVALLLLGLALVAAGSLRSHKVYEPGTDDFGIDVFTRISERDQVGDATFGGVRRIDGKLTGTYDRSKQSGRQACPT